MTGLLDIWEKNLQEMEGEIDQSLPAGKYVWRFGKPFKKIVQDPDDPTKESMDVSISFNVVRPLDRKDGFNAAKYKSVWRRFRNSETAQFVRFLKLAGFDGSMKPEVFLNTQSGRQYVADLTYTPNKNQDGEPWANLNGLVPMDIYEQRLAKLMGTARTSGGSDELE